MKYEPKHVYVMAVSRDCSKIGYSLDPTKRAEVLTKTTHLLHQLAWQSAPIPHAALVETKVKAMLQPFALTTLTACRTEYFVASALFVQEIAEAVIKEMQPKDEPGG